MSLSSVHLVLNTSETGNRVCDLTFGVSQRLKWCYLAVRSLLEVKRKLYKTKTNKYINKNKHYTPHENSPPPKKKKRNTP